MSNNVVLGLKDRYCHRKATAELDKAIEAARRAAYWLDKADSRDEQRLKADTAALELEELAGELERS